MMTLIQTPDGEWIQPAIVGSIMINEDIETSDKKQNTIWQVTVYNRGGGEVTTCLPNFKSLRDAQDCAYTIADAVNRAIKEDQQTINKTIYKAQ